MNDSNYLLAIIPLSILIVFFLKSPKNCLIFIVLFIYTGLLFSINIGFTFKASQIFSILCFIAIIFQFLAGNKKVIQIPINYYFPFLIFFIPIFFSLINISYDLFFKESGGGFRLLFNYIILQIMLFVISNTIKSKDDLKLIINISFVSCFITLVFGFYQQIGYYCGWYDPIKYIGIHSTFADFYGPFLRFSPGTFANEYGKILQTVSILLIVYLVLLRNEISVKVKVIYFFLLIIIFIAFILNATRTSWFILFFLSLIVLFKTKIKLKTLFFILLFLVIVVGGIFQFSIKLLNLDIFQIINQRFIELSDLFYYSTGTRIENWKYSLEEFQKHPFIGNGWGGFVETHSVPIQLLAETGLIGFFTFYGMVFFILKKGFSNIKLSQDHYIKVTSIGVFLALIGCLIYDLVNHGIHHFVFWFLTGLILAIDRINIRNI